MWDREQQLAKLEELQRVIQRYTDMDPDSAETQSLFDYAMNDLYLPIRFQIRLCMLRPDLSLYATADKSMDDFIQKVSGGNYLKDDGVFLEDNKSNREFFEEESGIRYPEDPEKRRQIHDLVLHDWIDIDAFSRRLFQLSLLGIEFAYLPAFAKDYVRELRCAYSCGNYLAALCLMRTILEIFVDNIYAEKDHGQEEGCEPKFFNKVQAILGRNRRSSEIRALYLEMNAIVHGDLFNRGTPPQEKTLNLIKRTFEVIGWMDKKMSGD